MCEPARSISAGMHMGIFGARYLTPYRLESVRDHFIVDARRRAFSPTLQLSMPLSLRITPLLACHWTMPRISSSFINARKKSRPLKEGDAYSGPRCVTSAFQLINSSSRPNCSRVRVGFELPTRLRNTKGNTNMKPRCTSPVVEPAGSDTLIFL